MTNELKVSALMPVRNGEFWIDTAVEAIISNIQRFDEVIIINDGSIDGTAKKLDYWANREARLRVLTLAGRGIVGALNLGLKEAQNPWIARFDVDDIYPSNRLSIQRMLVQENVGAIFCDYKFISSESENLGVIPSAIFSAPTALSLVNSQRTPHPGVLFNKDIADSVGGYRDEDFLVEDLSLWLRMAKVSELISAPQILLNYNLHPSSTSLQNRSQMFANKNSLIAAIGIDPKYAQNVIENYDSIVNNYSAFTYPTERELLLLKDLLDYSKGIKSRSLQKDIFKLALNIKRKRKKIGALAKLHSEKKSRKRIRFSNS